MGRFEGGKFVKGNFFDICGGNSYVASIRAGQVTTKVS